MGKMTEKENDETEWIPKSYFNGVEEESSCERLVRKCKESPTVPLGLAATIGALVYGLINFYKDKQVKQQYAMRARVAFQGLTLAAITYSIYQEGRNRMKQENEKESQKT